MYLGIVMFVLGFGLLLLATYFGLFIPNPQDPCYDKVKGGYKPSGWNRPSCAYVTESSLDSSIPKAPTLYLGRFVSSTGAGPAVCTPRWYATRLVRLSDGAYGELSEWTSSPVIANSDDPRSLPYAPGITPVGGCNLNLPTLITLDPIPKGYHLNIHRHLGSAPNTTTIGKVIGTSITQPYSIPKSTSFFFDVVPTNTGDGDTCC